MGKNSKELFDKVHRYSIRCLGVGVVSVVVGAVFFAGNPVLAEEAEASSTQSMATESAPSRETSKSEVPEVSGDKAGDTSSLSNSETKEGDAILATNDARNAEPKPAKYQAEASPSSVTGSETESSDPNKEEERADQMPLPVEPKFTKTAEHLGKISSVTANSQHKNVFDIQYESGQKGRLSFYNDHVVRYHVVDSDAEFLETPTPSQADRPADIVVKQLNDSPATDAPVLSQEEKYYKFETNAIILRLHREFSTLSILDKRTRKIALSEAEPLKMSRAESTQTLMAGRDSQYFGGGTQNGRFTHKGKSIRIVNENNWVDNGVASPNPFYWTTDGYGVLRHTFKPGKYDFESKKVDQVTSSHSDHIFDAFYFVNQKPVEILKDYYQLTGAPQVLPIFALYEGHLNAYNRDYWVEVTEGTWRSVYFKEKGKWYKEYQPNELGDRKGIRESLNGEKTDENYAFTARAVVDRYKEEDMPLGWMLVNDGYGAGYGQTGSLKGNIENLKKFSEYADKNGVKTGLWTQSDLHPKEGIDPLLQRDLPSEVKDGLVRILKTDVAWVGQGYSFGLNGIADAAKIMKEKGQNARPFIISLDGWGGTQRYAGIWTGDQTGGEWEYIRFHIPTYIGTGLSGQPNVTSDMDGIFGGGNSIINTRDFQWKTFTGIQLNMDGWGSNPKTPFAMDQTTTDLNRTYLKLKSTLVPYAYSLAHEAANGKPMIRAMFLEFPDEAINYSKAVQYQYMYGSNILVAPVYENVQADKDGNDVRNGIYLPAGSRWIDYFTGKLYEGGQTLNNFDSPIWKLPVFIREGAIIPTTTAHNNPSQLDHHLRQIDVYPHGESSFTLVEDDGLTEDYKAGKVAKTELKSQERNGHLVLTMEKTVSQVDNFTKDKKVQFNINLSQEPSNVHLSLNDQEVTLRKVTSPEEFEKGQDVYFYDARPNLNRYSHQGGRYYGQEIIKNPVLRIKSRSVDVTQTKVQLTMDGFSGYHPAQVLPSRVEGTAPQLNVSDERNTSTKINLDWHAVEGAKSYELEIDGIRHSNILTNQFVHSDLDYGSSHTYRVRAVLADYVTAWSEKATSQTKADPLSQAIDHIKISSNRNAQGGTPHRNLVDKNLGTMYHSDWTTNSVPETLSLDLGYAYDLDKLVYVPREVGTNGIITKFNLAFSTDGIHWRSYTQPIAWAGDRKQKEFKFGENITARYLQMEVTETISNQFVSGQELLVFQKENSKKRVVGDVSGDGKIGTDDLTSLTNYAGLRKTIDSDFKGYVEVADLNENGVIDAYDIYYVTRQLGQASGKEAARAKGNLIWTSDKQHAAAGDIVTFSLEGKGLKNVDALHASFRFDKIKYEIVDDTLTVSPEVSHMTNFSKVRTHGDGSLETFVIFANKKEAATLKGDVHVATFRLKSLVEQDVALQDQLKMLVGTDLLPIAPSDQLETEHPQQPSLNQISSDRIRVTGEDVYQSGQGLDHLIDNDPQTLTELKWDWAANYVNGKLPDAITLPQTIHFDFTREEPTYLRALELVKRTPGNGTVTKYKVTAYSGANKVYESDDIDTPFAEATDHLDLGKSLLVDKVDLTILEARTSTDNINNRMMTLKDVHFYEGEPSQDEFLKKIPGRELSISGQEDVYQAGQGLDHLIDDDPDTLAELKWDWEGNYVNGKLPDKISLPQRMSLKLADVRYIAGIELDKRTPGNGTVTKYKVAVYRDNQLVKESPVLEVDFAKANPSHYFEDLVVGDKVVVTILEARTDANTVNNRMMTLRGIKLYEWNRDLMPPIEAQTVEIHKGSLATDESAALVEDKPSLEEEVVPIAHKTVERENPNLSKGQRKIAQVGVDGKQVNLVEVSQSGRQLVGSFVKTAAVDEIIEVGSQEVVGNQSRIQNRASGQEMSTSVQSASGEKVTYSRREKVKALPETGATSSLLTWLGILVGGLGLGISRSRKR